MRRTALIFAFSSLTSVAVAGGPESPINILLTKPANAHAVELMKNFVKCEPSAARLGKGKVDFGGFIVKKASLAENTKTRSVTYVLSDDTNLDYVRDRFKKVTNVDVLTMEQSTKKGSVSFDTNEDGEVTLICILHK